MTQSDRKLSRYEWNLRRFSTCVNLPVNLRIRLATLRKSVREFWFCKLALISVDLHRLASPFGQCLRAHTRECSTNHSIASTFFSLYLRAISKIIHAQSQKLVAQKSCRLLAECRSTVSRRSADTASVYCRPTVDRPIGPPSTDCRHIGGKMTTDCRPIVGRLWMTIDRLSVDCRSTYRSTVDRQSTDATYNTHDPNNLPTDMTTQNTFVSSRSNTIQSTARLWRYQQQWSVSSIFS